MATNPSSSTSSMTASARLNLFVEMPIFQKSSVAAIWFQFQRTLATNVYSQYHLAAAAYVQSKMSIARERFGNQLFLASLDLSEGAVITIRGAHAHVEETVRIFRKLSVPDAAGIQYTQYGFFWQGKLFTNKCLLYAIQHIETLANGQSLRYSDVRIKSKTLAIWLVEYLAHQTVKEIAAVGLGSAKCDLFCPEGVTFSASSSSSSSEPVHSTSTAVAASSSSSPPYLDYACYSPMPDDFCSHIVNSIGA